ncbi:ABC transporter ATP-binding protein [Algoriphagus machipongonensis]|uniref:ABC transporter, ATP-binding protein n=1 Tax=Algoriphagus machipongonensis TaxID=388413 RepID=A3HZQ3_9BACT|nr:ABC transporter ATP-binding protein [Algoriphagus machipongonensis]EAZ80739.1 ABC transporter, ATP-binding protein [Algoriphagus machipongonensis]
MLKIQVEEASKRFQYEWIFKNLNLNLKSGDAIAITGGNGSGKSTLLKCLSGSIPLSSGNITYQTQNQPVADSDWFYHLTVSAPYMELPEEFTLKELLEFHFKFKTPLPGLSIDKIIETLYLESHANKPIAQFSSGMKQRVKLGVALFSDVPLVFLDEPTSNLDVKGVNWYQELVEQYKKDRIIIVCSNDSREYEYCTQKLNLEDYK